MEKSAHYLRTGNIFSWLHYCRHVEQSNAGTAEENRGEQAESVGEKSWETCTSCDCTTQAVSNPITYCSRKKCKVHDELSSKTCSKQCSPQCETGRKLTACMGHCSWNNVPKTTGSQCCQLFFSGESGYFMLTKVTRSHLMMSGSFAYAPNQCDHLHIHKSVMIICMSKCVGWQRKIFLSITCIIARSRLWSCHHKLIIYINVDKTKPWW